jgi:hypothetical protein
MTVSLDAAIERTHADRRSREIAEKAAKLTQGIAMQFDLRPSHVAEMAHELAVEWWETREQARRQMNERVG